MLCKFTEHVIYPFSQLFIPFIFVPLGIIPKTIIDVIFINCILNLFIFPLIKLLSPKAEQFYISPPDIFLIVFKSLLILALLFIFLPRSKLIILSSKLGIIFIF